MIMREMSLNKGFCDYFGEVLLVGINCNKDDSNKNISIRLIECINKKYWELCTIDLQSISST